MKRPVEPTLRAEAHEIVSNIFAMCELAGMNQSELARRTNLTRAAISRWAVGLNSPSLENLIKISEALEKPLHELLVSNTATEKAKQLREFDEQYQQARAELMKSA